MKAIVAWNGYGRLLAAILEISACLITCHKVYKGSGSPFAYKLMAFTFMQGVAFFIMFIAIICAPTTFVTEDGETKKWPNFYTMQVGLFFWSISQLQLWLFGVKYMQSAINFSNQPLICNKKQLNRLFWGIVVMFVAASIIVSIIWMGAFPGYSDPNFNHWFGHTYRNTFKVYCVFWLILSVSVIYITVYSVYRIIKSFQLIQEKEPSLTLKTRPMIAHCLLIFVTLTL